MSTVTNVSSSANSIFANSGTTASTSAASTTSSSATDALGNTQTFLSLLVAQLKNQDPTQPVDGTTFVTQLAQFSNLEQSVAMRQDIDSISAKYVGTSTTAATASSTNPVPTSGVTGS